MNKLEKFIVGAGIVASSFLPMKKAEAQNYYGKISLGGKIPGDSFVQEHFGMLPGIKGGVGLYSGGSRVEIEAALFGKGNYKKDMTMGSTHFMGYYDLVLKPEEKFNVSLGAGIGFGEAHIFYLDVHEKDKIGGFMWGLRGGVEINAKKVAVLFNIGYNEVSGKVDNDNVSMGSTELELGVRIPFK